MENLKKYGNSPFNIVVVHGGPGAAGEIAPVAKELSKVGGVLEPLQTKKSVQGQIQELKEVIENNGNPPVTLIGWSWGAWLCYMLAANYPSLIAKLILVGSGPFEERYAKEGMAAMLSRLSEADKVKLQALQDSLANPEIKDKGAFFESFGKLFEKVDTYAPIDAGTEKIELRPDIYESVWQQAAELRRSGKLLAMGEKIQCPVVAIHGDYDPHPAEGVKKPLLKAIKNFRFILLEKCGHKPWVEKEAKDKFYQILKEELV